MKEREKQEREMRERERERERDKERKRERERAYSQVMRVLSWRTRGLRLFQRVKKVRFPNKREGLYDNRLFKKSFSDYFTPCESFIPELAGGLPQISE